jgi:hypothetical protein
MVNYKLGKVYRLNCTTDPSLFYVGSTTIKYLSSRKSNHEGMAKTRPSLLYKTMREKGIQNFQIILIESYPCDNKDELFARESYYINLLKPTLNTYDAIINVDKKKIKNDRFEATEKRIQYKKDQAIKYRAENKEQISERSKIKVKCDLCDDYLSKGSMYGHKKRFHS